MISPQKYNRGITLEDLLTETIDRINQEATALIRPIGEAVAIKSPVTWDALVTAAQSLVTVRAMIRERMEKARG